MRRKKIYKSHIFIGSLLIIISIIYFTTQEVSNNLNYSNTDIAKDYLNTQYFAWIEIPKIDLKKELYGIDSVNNDVKYGIQILNNSSMPDILNGNLILASHSGNSKISYFKNLYKLRKNDYVYVFYKNKKYTYKVVNIYKIDKVGIAKIYRKKNKNTLTMITCDKSDNTKQIVIISEIL